MSTPLSPKERLGRAFTAPTRGVLGLVDELLAASWNHELQLDWQADNCRVRLVKDGLEDLLEIPLRKSVFRAALARVGVLCNERKPNSVSPHGGQGELSFGSEPAAVFRVAFANTPDEQSLQLVRVAPERTLDGRVAGQPATSCDGGRPARVLP
jgi:hypothetical protein